MTEQIVVIYSVSVVLCLLLAGHWLLVRAPRPLAARVLAVNYLLHACQSGLAVMAIGYAWVPAQMLRANLAMLLGPALYSYYLTLARGRPIPSPWHLLHLLPVVAAGLLIASGSPWRTAIDWMIMASFFVYLTLIAYPLFSPQLAHLGSHQAQARLWLGILAGLLLVGLGVEAGVYLEFTRGTPVQQSWSLVAGAALFALFNGVTVLLALWRSPLLEWMHHLGRESLNRRPPLSDQQARAIFERWEDCVRQQSLHKQEGGITLNSAARKLGIPARQLSESINRVHGTGFSQYLNAYRVQQAQRLMASQPHLTLTELMSQAGFESKSHFNKEFKRLTQMSPSAYRESVALSDPEREENISSRAATARPLR